MDSLSQIMSWLRTEGHIYGRMELTAPFGLRFPYQHGICLIVTRGICYLNTDDGELVALSAGDFAFIPNSKVFYLRSDRKVKADQVVSAEQASDYLTKKTLVHNGGSGVSTSLISGCFHFPLPESQLLIDKLPKIMHLKSDEVSSWIQPLFQIIQREISDQSPGSASVIDRAAEILLMQAIRKYADYEDSQTAPSWLKGLGDEKIAEALRIIHNDFKKPLTVEGIAETIGMSRSHFADRFKKTVGQTPLEHMTEWRMIQAARLMRESKNLKLSSVAEAVGYESDAAFRKAFARTMKQTPSAYRVDHQSKT